MTGFLRTSSAKNRNPCFGAAKIGLNSITAKPEIEKREVLLPPSFHE